MRLPKAAIASALLVVAIASFVRAVDGTEPIKTMDGAQQEPITPIPAPPALDARKSALGERLFNDARLSGQGAISCASCHDLQTNGARAMPGEGRADTQGGFDTVSVFNAALNSRLTWLGVFRTLEAQAEASLRNPQTMNADLDVILGRLNADSEIEREFLTAYGKSADRESLFDALATFERSLLTPDSRFDSWLLGDRDALSAQEIAGYQLFKTLGCISCHQGVNVGGNLYQKPGVFRSLSKSAPALVRVPSLRNVAATAPYFHDGSAATLDDAIYRMARAQLNATIGCEEVEALKAFLGTLTGVYRGQPVRPAE